ncbi:hypothetical protein [Micromonospora sp. NPDC047730]|uniref:hypothetical protein n=1 Tax=Micromonospora sp. NPDC047730 TaxID=3364253 RepID=UPI00371724A8
MGFLRDFERGDRVFVAQGVDEWLGIEVVGGDAEEGVVYGRVLLTNGIPGYEKGEVIPLVEGLLAYRELTVDVLLAREERG